MEKAQMGTAHMGKATSTTAASSIVGGGVGVDCENASRGESGVDAAAAGRADGKGAHEKGADEKGGAADAFI